MAINEVEKIFLVRNSYKKWGIWTKGIWDYYEYVLLALERDLIDQRSRG